jgi:hypothetical protein
MLICLGERLAAVLDGLVVTVAMDPVAMDFRKDRDRSKGSRGMGNKEDCKGRTDAATMRQASGSLRFSR